jgi:class 3 adenylate cyclase
MLAGLTGLWFVCFLLHLGQVVQGRLAWIPVYVAAADGPDAFPTVRALWPGVATGELAPGDSIASVGGVSLAGAMPLDFVTAVYRHAVARAVSLERVRGGVATQVELALVPLEQPWRRSASGAAFALLGALTFWRTRGSRAGRAFYFGMTAYAMHWTDFWANGPVIPAGLTSFAFSTTLFMPLALRTALVFPEDAAGRPRRVPLWPWLFALNGPIVMSWAFGVPFGSSVSRFAALALQIAFIAVFVTLLTRSYRAAGPIGRRQLKWVIIGLWIGLGPELLAGSVALAAPTLWWLYEASLGFALFLPVCLFIAFARYNLLDVDRLLTTAVISPLIGIGLISFGLLTVPTVASAAQGWVDPKVSQPALSLVIGGGAFLILRRVDRLMQDRIYPERRILALEAQRLRLELAECTKAADVLTLLARRVGEILKLVTTAIYSRGPSEFSPVFARGPAVTPAFALDGPLASELAARASPLEPFNSSWHDDDPAEDAALAAMGVEIAVPVLPRAELAGFLCLGGKRSGDVFTTTDRALLQGLADKAADELLHFDREDLARETRQLMEQLRAYVPGAVARELAAGSTLEAGEREVTVLFVDIRGYTAFTEGQAPAAIFGAVSAYTKLVSQIVADCGGAVVEFNGDGLMTVFGAPRALADKERAAVRAARAIARDVPGLSLRDSAGRPHRFHVGIGVATGPGYVGNVRAVDRSIWVALGNTTNLAARLERMTRELGAAVVIDAETHKAAGDACADFALQPDQSVRGRSERIDVYTWSPPGSSAPPLVQEEAT